MMVGLDSSGSLISPGRDGRILENKEPTHDPPEGLEDLGCNRK